jgi:serine/threonine protein kinase
VDNELGTRCLTNGQLTSLIVGRSEAEDEVSWSAHLDHCAACQVLLEELAGGTEWLPEQVADPVGRLEKPSLEYSPALPRAATSDAWSRDSAANPGEALGDASLAAFLRPSDRPEFPARFGPFYVIEIVGRGGMGIVFKAFDPSLRRVVAVKVLAPQLATSKTARVRFLREARAAAQVIDDHVITIHSVDENRGFPFLVMEFVKGESLEARLRRSGLLPLRDVLRIAREVALGLRAAHAAGLVHRDIKPANILLEESTGRCKITDFGLARAVEDETLTRSGCIAGTPHYMAPEQALGEPVDSRTDLYSLGAVLYHACSGQPPFDGTTPLSVLSKVVEKPVPKLDTTNASVPGWLEGVIGILMAKDRSKRLPSADELLTRLSQSETALASISQRARYRHVGIAACLVLAGLVLVAAMVIHSARSSAHRRLGLLAREGSRSSHKVKAARPVRIEHCRVVYPDGTGRAAKNLREALALATDGSTIELDDSEPLEVGEPLDTLGKSLLIRAAPGATPIVIMKRSRPSANSARLTASGPLALEGIEFRYVEASQRPANHHALILTRKQPLLVSNCKFDIAKVRDVRLACIQVEDAEAVIRNSVFSCSARGTGILASVAGTTQIEAENCGILAPNAFTLSPGTGGRASREDVLGIHSCTVVGQGAIHLLGRGPGPSQEDNTLRIRSSRCLFDVGYVFTVDAGPVSEPVRAELETLERLSRSTEWCGADNIYAIGQAYCGFSLRPRSFATARSGPRSLSSWQDFCHEEAVSSREARVFFPDAEAGARPQPGDPIDGGGFRFVLDRQERREISQIGASVATLGPGQAYESWQRSPAGEQWATRRQNMVGN